MIGREAIQNLTSIQDVDKEIITRQTRLNGLAASIEPQILSEEIVELRLRRTEIEDKMVDYLSQCTGVSATECRTILLKYKWNMKAVASSMSLISTDGYGFFFGEYGHKYHLCRDNHNDRTITAICGFSLQKRGGFKEARILLQDNVCPRCIEIGLQPNGVAHAQGNLRALPEVPKVS